MIDVISSQNGVYVRDKQCLYDISPPVFSLRNYRHLRNRSIITGFVGPRGSGKSVGGTRTVVLDYLLAGYDVWSNMDIGINLIKNHTRVELCSKPLEKLELVELDEVYKNGLLFIDEINMEFAEARRAMSKQNLMFSYILQQLRKRRLNMIWTCQSEMHVEERLRWQTDVFIMCKDISIMKPNCGIGELSRWTAFDYTGLIKGESPRNSQQAVFYEGIVWNKPWWNAFDTWKLQGTDLAEKNDKSGFDVEAEELANEIAEFMNSENIIDIKSRQIWERWGIKNHSLKTRVGILLSEKGITKSSDRKRYILDEEDN